MQIEINKISDWLNINKLTINLYDLDHQRKNKNIIKLFL